MAKAGSAKAAQSQEDARAQPAGGAKSAARPQRRRAHAPLRARQRFGKYRIDRRLGEGGFAVVYKAYDLIEGLPVALKLPHPKLLSPELLNQVRREVRVVANLEHPNVLPLRSAAEIEGQLVIATPLGVETLAGRMKRRLSARQALDFTEQLLDGLAHAHEQGIIHCDVKPDNVILFEDNRLRLADFGIAKVALSTRTMASGAGTIGYIAPEQAMGRPIQASDVFSLSLVVYRMFSGQLPEWPYHWPLPGADRLRAVARPEFVQWLRKGLAIDARKRFPDAVRMSEAFERIRRRALKQPRATTGRTASGRRRSPAAPTVAWKSVRFREFRRRHGAVLGTRDACPSCKGPVSEAMHHCPWCGKERRVAKGPTRLPASCKRCGRGVKLDWDFCAHCYGGRIGPQANRTYTDTAYEARCSNRACTRREMLPFSRYCPWCRTKVRRRWSFEGATGKCTRCRWGTVPEFWDHCPWCGRHHANKSRKG